MTKTQMVFQTQEVKKNRQFIGNSRQSREVLNQAVTASRHPNTNLFISGESGTGKENIARIIHYLSSGEENQFYVMNGSNMNELLFQCVLFGHKQEYLKKAASYKKRFSDSKPITTLFLDEIADLSESLQLIVYLALEDIKFDSIRDTNLIAPEFRIISTTNHDPDELLKENKIRTDLLKRLNTIHIHIPPLRERAEDIEPLVKHFAKRFSMKSNKPAPEISDKTIRSLKNYDFPGNVRELKNMTERAIMLSKTKSLRTKDFQFSPGV